MRKEGLAGAVRYVLATYSEFSLVALLTLYFTNMASQQVLADSSIAFIVISYSTFLALGFHNGAIRDGAISSTVEGKERILRLEVWFSAVIALLLMLAAFICRERFYLMAGLFIGGVNHLKTACQTVFRLLGMDMHLNTLNVTWAGTFFVSFGLVLWLFKGHALEIQFFGAWSFAAFVVVFSFFVYCWRKLNISSNDRSEDIKLFWKVLSASKYMFLMASGLVVVLTSDRLVLNVLGAVERVRADFQYIDVLTNIYFLGMTSVLYYFTPGLLKRFSGENAADGDFQSMMIKYTGYLSGVMMVFVLAIMVFLQLVGRFDWALVEILVSMLLLKTMLICLGFVCNFYLAQRLEKVLAVAYLGLMVVGLGLSFVFGRLFTGTSFIVFLPLLNALLVGALVAVLFKRIRVQGSHEKSTCIN
ncbi:hypothetical protein DCO48_00775 [Pseudomonas sp. SDI]|uniref:hypothetical protein n=1 Tax=Pseudomonas sp. SDI TaxID=2170734 RepID=UPI000DE78E99|nr:hypothetical protein [Pseudomonas sp. SDI]PWB36013.1 hypothetical protein DCO48_00775 [Pseudomonas sp. SDI]